MICFVCQEPGVLWGWLERSPGFRPCYELVFRHQAVECHYAFGSIYDER